MGGTAAGAVGVLCLHMLGALHIPVQEQLPAVGQIHAALPHIAGGVLLKRHAAQLAFHYADDDPCQHKADAQRKEQVHERQRLPGQVIHVIGVALPGSVDVGIRPLDKGAECTGVISIGHEGGHLLAKVLDAGVRKGGDAVAAGGDVPLAVACAYQQQYAVTVCTVAELTVVIEVIGIFLHAGVALAFQRVDGGNSHIKALADAQLLQ